MKTRVILSCLLALMMFSCVYVRADEVNVTLGVGDIEGIQVTINKPLMWEKGTQEDLRLVAERMRLQENDIIEELKVYDYSLTERANETVQKWLDDFSPVTSPDGYEIIGIITEVDHHEPYGVLETRIEVLRVDENNTEFDWYDVSVSQILTPGANYTSDWEWNEVTYTMNGSLGSGNVMLSEYDSPPSYEAPSGIFTFLWRILGIDLRNYLPWVHAPEPRIQGTDMSDFSIELFRVRYSVPENYRYKNEPFTVRHHYVVRMVDGESPVFWHQTQVQYTQAGSYAKIPYITPPLASGYIKIR